MVRIDQFLRIHDRLLSEQREDAHDRLQGLVELTRRMARLTARDTRLRFREKKDGRSPGTSGRWREA